MLVRRFLRGLDQSIMLAQALLAYQASAASLHAIGEALCFFVAQIGEAGGGADFVVAWMGH
jgi:hypothetical protein